MTWAYYQNRGVDYSEYQRRRLQDACRRLRAGRKLQRHWHQLDAEVANKRRREHGERAHYFKVISEGVL